MESSEVSVAEISTELTIRNERPDDHGRVGEIQRAAFGRASEAELVVALRREAKPLLSLVVERRGELIGHILFTPVEIEGAVGCPPCAGLAPLAVLPQEQAQGAGSALVRAGLHEAVQLGWHAVFLLGDPAYYARFGFGLTAPRGLHYESKAFDRAFQYVELVPDALSGCRGWVRYHAAFTKL